MFQPDAAKAKQTVLDKLRNNEQHLILDIKIRTVSWVLWEGIWMSNDSLLVSKNPHWWD